MYSLVLMAALTTGATEPGCHWRCYSSCQGGYGCYGGSCYGCYGGGCYGCYGGGCYGCYGGGCYGCYGGGCYGGVTSFGCFGCYGYGCYGAVSPYHPMIVQPAAPKPETVPTPKDKPAPMKDDKKNDKKETDSQARLIIEVPADAKLFIDDQPMKTSAARRVFRTPQLDQGQTYFYILRAEVVRDGKVQSKTQRVILRAGDEVVASFSDMRAPVETTASAEK